MQDEKETPKEEEEENIGCISSLFNLLGSFGFLLLIPIVLFYFGIEAPQKWLSAQLGSYGSLDFFVFVSFSLLTLRILFGSARQLLPINLALLASAPLIFTTMEIASLTDLQQAFLNIPYFAHKSLNFIIGVFILLMGVQLSHQKKESFLAHVFLVIVVPYAALFGLITLGITPKNDNTTFSLKEGYQTASEGTQKAISLIDQKYQNDPKVQQYIKDVVEDTTTKENEKEKLIQELTQRIEKLETDKKKTAQVRQENEQFKKEIDELNARKPAETWCLGAHQTSQRLYQYDQAVQLATPCVRDLAVHLASTQEGTYHKSNQEGVPTKTGLLQIASIHTYISDQWKYVNDPTRTGSDYLSEASRSISLGFAGDCDDFSIVMASLIGSIGGTTRIMHGECSNGAHAWAEVLIGTKTDWDNMQQTLQKHYSSPNRQFSGHESNGEYWLSLDWKLGELSCADTNITMQWSHAP